MRATLVLTLGLAACPNQGETSVKEPATQTSHRYPTETQKQAPEDAESARWGRTPHPSIQLSYSRQALEAGVTSTSFDFMQLRTLWVRLNLTAVLNVQPVTVKLRDPLGVTMYEATVVFTPDPNMTSVDMPGINPIHAMVPHRVNKHPGGYHLDYPITILGSSITRFPEPGPWHVEANVSGSSLLADLDVTFIN